MEPRKILQSQYCAALEMLKQAIEHCPDAMWNAAGDKNKFWQVAYHTLFYTHLYLQKAVADFKPWDKHQEGLQQPGSATGETAAYGREEILAYLAICQEEVADKVRLLDLKLHPALNGCLSASWSCRSTPSGTSNSMPASFTNGWAPVSQLMLTGLTIARNTLRTFD
jgi:hypothetical protein